MEIDIVEYNDKVLKKENNKQKKSKKRKNPEFNPVPSMDQQFIVRKITQKGMKIVAEGIPYSDDLINETEWNICHFHENGTFVLLSTKPRPSHIATWVIKNSKVVRFEIKNNNIN